MHLRPIPSSPATPPLLISIPSSPSTPSSLSSPQLSISMSCATPFLPPSPAHFSNLRLTELELPPFSCGLSASITPPSSLSFSPAHHNRTPFTDLLQCKTKHLSPLQSPRNRAVSSPRGLSSLGSDARTRPTKENRAFATSDLPKNGGANRGPLERKKPAKLVIPESARLASLGKVKQFVLPEQDCLEFSHGYEVTLFAVSSKRGRKDHMEDVHTASTHFQGNPKQAFFGVFDGHGGKHAADFAASNLGQHISAAIQNHKEGQACLEDAIRTGYLTADAEFLDKRLGGGACAVSAFVKEGEMVVSNAGDCKAVLCRAGKAESLSTIHRASNEAERQRVEDLGAFVDCFNGVWRVQGTLAVTRGFGDAKFKRWVSAEPAVKKIDITHDCEFLILASDGLWDQMHDQEAVDCARRILVESEVLSNATRNVDHTTETASKDHISCHPASICTAGNKEDNLQTSSCKANASLRSVQNKIDNTQVSNCKTNACNELIRIACQRGNRDDITVMIVLLQDFAVA